jgi:hypothetical protein
VLSVVFAAPGTAGLSEAVNALARFYAPLGHAGSQVNAVEGGAVGWIALDESEHARLHAESHGRRLTWEGATFDWRDGALRTEPGPALPTTLFRCDGVVATHAVAAAWLARRRRPRVRMDLIPELVLHEFVLGLDTLIEATAPVIRAGRWPAAPPEEGAKAAALDALLTVLRTGAGERPALGLTAGLDSRVVAAALADLRIPATTFTWSHHEEDAAGAAAIAARFGLPHQRLAPEWLDDAAGLAELQADVRWSEGAAPLTPFGRVGYPDGLSSFVTGGGGEIGRAFYYRFEVANHNDPGVNRLVRLLNVRERIPHASPETIKVLQRRLVLDLQTLPREGWRRLDHFYARRRVARWGRAMLGRAPAATLPAFATPAVASALIAMSERDRVSDGFHRFALRELAGEEVPTGRTQRRGVPAPVRRVAARVRRQGRDAPPRHPYADEIDARPLYREWLDEAITRTELNQRWIDALREGVATGHERRVAQAMLATAPVALADALRDLPESI